MKKRIVLALLVTFVLCTPPVWADDGWKKILHLTLSEYGDPAIARQGYLDIWANESIQPPYGYPYYGIMHVDGICALPTINLQSGDAVAWVSAVVTDYAIIKRYDPYAEWAAVFPYDDRKSPPDGSRGYDYPAGGCPDVTSERNRHGFLALFIRFEEYQTSDSSGNKHIADLYDCSEELSCNWYYVYSKP
jgi:hypothetical protein